MYIYATWSALSALNNCGPVKTKSYIQYKVNQHTNVFSQINIFRNITSCERPCLFRSQWFRIKLMKSLLMGCSLIQHRKRLHATGASKYLWWPKTEAWCQLSSLNGDNNWQAELASNGIPAPHTFINNDLASLNDRGHKLYCIHIQRFSILVSYHCTFCVLENGMSYSEAVFTVIWWIIYNTM